jgi:hypothetical protein
MRQPAQVFQTVKESVITSSAITVLSIFLGGNKHLVTSQSSNCFLSSPLVMDETQVSLLPALRLKGIDGGVLVLSFTSPEKLMENYRILRWGDGSHMVSQFPWDIRDLIMKVSELVPMEPENLKMLQSELAISADKILDEAVGPCLNDLIKNPRNARTVNQLANIISEIRARTPVACHSVVSIDGKELQIQQHLDTYINALHERESTTVLVIYLLREVFHQWRDLVVKSGEGLN